MKTKPPIIEKSLTIPIYRVSSCRTGGEYYLDSFNFDDLYPALLICREAVNASLEAQGYDLKKQEAPELLDLTIWSVQPNLALSHAIEVPIFLSRHTFGRIYNCAVRLGTVAANDKQRDGSLEIDGEGEGIYSALSYIILKKFFAPPEDVFSLYGQNYTLWYHVTPRQA